MPDIILLSPQVAAAITEECKALLTSIHVEIIDEDLRLKTGSTTIYFARWKTWLGEPKPRIRKIAPTGVETLLQETTNYAINSPTGEVTLVATLAAGEILRADYLYQPLTDAVIDDLWELSVGEVSVLIFRAINPLSVPAQYQTAACKRLYTNILKNLMAETRDYFAVSVAGRSISKDNLPAHFDLIIKANEMQLQQELNYLRHFNQTQRFE